jgi:hypothetical protein
MFDDEKSSRADDFSLLSDDAFDLETLNPPKPDEKARKIITGSEFRLFL